MSSRMSHRAPAICLWVCFSRICWKQCHSLFLYSIFHLFIVHAKDHYDADPSIEARCDCLPECEETIYDVSVSSSAIPNDYARESLVESLNVPQINAGNIDKNIIRLKIFFREMRYTLIEQQRLYSSTSLFGELGGQMGLCLGASFLTAVELLQLLGTLCAWLCKRPSEETTTIHVQPQN